MPGRVETKPTRIPAGPRRIELFLLAFATAVGSAGLAAGAGAPIAGVVVAFGDVAALSLAGAAVAATAVLALAFVRRTAAGRT